MKAARNRSLVWPTLLVVVLAAATAGASTRAARFVESLAALESAAQHVRVEPSSASVRLGDTIDYRIEAELGGYLTVLQLDAHGGVRVLVPSASAPLGWIAAGQALSLRGVPVAGPVGPARTYALSTPAPIVSRSSALAARPERQRLGPEAALALVRKLRRGVEVGGAIGSAELRIHGSGQVEYTVSEIVERLVRTRAVRRPRIDFHHVLFSHDSALLTDEAKRNLDVLAEALATPDLEGERFVLSGHTDHVGSRAYNQALSERRARSARRYLTEHWGIAVERIEVRGRGEDQPLEAGSSPEARRANRRVQLEVVE